MTNKLFIIGVSILISALFVSCEQTNLDKTDFIIKKLGLVENQKLNYEYVLEPLKCQAVGDDTLKIIELERKLTEDEISKRIISSFEEVYSDKEINEIYQFIQTSAFEKFYTTGEINKAMMSKFEDINTEIEELSNKIEEPKPKTPRDKFEPISVDREDGFYATIEYHNSMENKDIKLEEKPVIRLEDIQEVKKEYSKNYEDQPVISIILTKEGTRKFYLATKKNIGKPIAIVIGKKIVSLPIVSSEIINGKINISGNFSENEIEDMIKKLKNKTS